MRRAFAFAFICLTIWNISRSAPRPKTGAQDPARWKKRRTIHSVDTRTRKRRAFLLVGVAVKVPAGVSGAGTGAAAASSAVAAHDSGCSASDTASAKTRRLLRSRGGLLSHCEGPAPQPRRMQQLAVLRARRLPRGPSVTMQPGVSVPAPCLLPPSRADFPSMSSLVQMTTRHDIRSRCQHGSASCSVRAHKRGDDNAIAAQRDVCCAARITALLTMPAPAAS